MRYIRSPMQTVTTGRLLSLVFNMFWSVANYIHDLMLKLSYKHDFAVGSVSIPDQPNCLLEVDVRLRVETRYLCEVTGHLL